MALFFNRESRLLAFSVIRSGVKLNCCPSDRRQNILIRGNHLPVSNELGYATSSKISASILQIFLKIKYQRQEFTYRFLNVFQRLYYVLSVRFLEKGVFTGLSLEKAVCSLQACNVCHSSFGVCAYHDGNYTGARRVSRQFFLRLCLFQFC